jgi:hypothetical protein
MNETRDGDDHRIRVFEIEFIGGPYDGHKEPCFTSPAHLSAEVVWLVCEDAFLVLAGKDPHSGGSLTSVAVYELEVGNGAVRYRFARAISVKELTHSIRET